MMGFSEPGMCYFLTCVFLLKRVAGACVARHPHPTAATHGKAFHSSNHPSRPAHQLLKSPAVGWMTGGTNMKKLRPWLDREILPEIPLGLLRPVLRHLPSSVCRCLERLAPVVRILLCPFVL